MKKGPEKKTLKVVELFAGVGGFKLGLEQSKSKEHNFKVVWSNQWEPSTKIQHASQIYKQRFPDCEHVSEDIAKVEVKDIPNHNLLVGGFPCQDYSVAKILSHSKGLVGKKGVLWWEIVRIIREKGEKAPEYLMLENVDRLIKSPSSQRGRDFAVMLASLSDLGYAVEWRIINAADYGMPQRRRRIYIMGYRKNTAIYKNIVKNKIKTNWLINDGIFAKSFPVEKDILGLREFEIEGGLDLITDEFNHGKNSPFDTGGVMLNRQVTTGKLMPFYKGKYTVLKDILDDDKKIPNEYYIDEKDLKKWNEHKGAKNEIRTTKEGFEYNYTEGSMVFPDSLDKPSRTIVTGEGGKTPSRFKHVIKTKKGLRRLMPVELERLNMFPDNHTEGAADVKRAFFMGNALVVGVIEKLGKSLLDNMS